MPRSFSAPVLTDWSPPDDLNATLEPYGEKWELPGGAVKITESSFWADRLWRVDMVAVNGVKKMAGG